MSVQKVDVLAWIDQATTGLHCLSKDSSAALNGAAVKQAVAELIEALETFVEQPVRYNDNRIEIDAASHSEAMSIVRTARAAIAKARGEKA